MKACGRTWEDLISNELRKVYFGKDFLLIPLNEDHHWSLVCLDLKNHLILHYDSLPGFQHVNGVLLIQHTIGNYLRDEEEWKIEKMKEIPLQENSHDCGVFMCQYAKFISAGKACKFLQSDVHTLRDTMIYEIEKGLLLQIPEETDDETNCSSTNPPLMNVEEVTNDPSFNDVQKSPPAKKKKSDIRKGRLNMDIKSEVSMTSSYSHRIEGKEIDVNDIQGNHSKKIPQTSKSAAGGDEKVKKASRKITVKTRGRKNTAPLELKLTKRKLRRRDNKILKLKENLNLKTKECEELKKINTNYQSLQTRKSEGEVIASFLINQVFDR